MDGSHNQDGIPLEPEGHRSYQKIIAVHLGHFFVRQG